MGAAADRRVLLTHALHVFADLAATGGRKGIFCSSRPAARLEGHSRRQRLPGGEHGALKTGLAE